MNYDRGLSLVKAFFTHIDHRFEQLAYNVNWGIDTGKLGPFLREYPVSLFDIGARGGSIPELEALTDFTRYFGFDADAEECTRLRSHPPKNYREFQIFPYFIGHETGPIDFHLYNQRGLSSTLPIDEDFNQAFFVPPVRLENTIRLQANTLDDVRSRERLDMPDLLKLDTQGSELGILQGARVTLQDTLLVEAEVEFCAIYKGQALFAEVDQFLRSAGFELLYLNRYFLQRKGIYRGVARGQIIFGDVLYGRKLSTLSALTEERIAKYIVLLCHYGHIDLAQQIFAEHPSIARSFPDIVHCFGPAPSLFRRGLVSQLDKFICLLLHLRKTNHAYSESDRSWPIR